MQSTVQTFPMEEPNTGNLVQTTSKEHNISSKRHQILARNVAKIFKINLNFPKIFLKHF